MDAGPSDPGIGSGGSETVFVDLCTAPGAHKATGFVRPVPECPGTLSNITPPSTVRVGMIGDEFDVLANTFASSADV